MTEKAKLAFGVEFELLLKPKEEFIARLKRAYPDWATKFEQIQESESKAAAQDGLGANANTNTNTNTPKSEAEALRDHFREKLAVLLMRVDVPAATATLNFREWSVVDEPTLDEVPGYCRVELVSRTISSDDDWQVEFDTVFRRLNSSFDLICTTGCSMHVHISPAAKPRREVKEDRWTPGQLNKIMKALSYFTGPVTQIMPSERKQNTWAMPNMLSDDIAKSRPQLRAAYKQVQTGTWKRLFDIYDSQMKKDLDRHQAFAIMGSYRRVAWNFEHITGTCGTVEFRQCPAVTVSAPGKHLASFTLGSIHAAAFQAFLDWSQIATQKTYPSIEDLDSFTKAGLGGLENTCQGALNSLEEDTSNAKVWSAEKTKKILEEEALLKSRSSPGS